MDRSRILVTLIAVISLSLGAIWPNGAMAAMAPAVQSLGALQEGLSVPGRVDVDAQGNVYVADARAKVILRYDASGVLRKTYSAVEVTGRGLAVSADGGRIYAEDEERIVILDGITGAQLGMLGGSAPLTRAGDVAVDAAGNVYAVDNLNVKVCVFDADGNPLRSFTGAGTGDGLFRRITALAVNAAAGEVYVAGEGVLAAGESGRSIVQVFGLDGVLRGKLVLPADFGGVVSMCRGIAFDNVGREYYIDTVKGDVRVRDRATGYLSTLAIAGGGDGKVAMPAGIEFDPMTSRLFVASDNGKVEVYGIDGGATPDRNQVPGVPQLISPVAGGEVTTLTPELHFVATDANGDSLEYEVSFSGASAPIMVKGAAGAEVAVVTSELKENAGYTWSVQASDGLDVSGFASEQTFYVNTVQEAPTAPVLISGAAGELLGGDGVLSWSTSVDADPGDTVTYSVEVATAEDFAAPVMTAQTAATQIALDAFATYLDLVDGSSYFWRVTAVDNHGDSAVSKNGQFVYDTAMLTVAANIPGSSVYLTGNAAYPGRFVGLTPCEFRDLASGQYTVVVEHAGCEAVIQQVEVIEKGNAAVAAELQLAVAPELRNAAELRAGSTWLQVAGDAAPVAVDFDGDGLTDLLVGDGVTGEVVFFQALEQRGAKVRYAEGRPLVPGVAPVVVDWNGDDQFDLLVGQVDGGVTLYTLAANGVTWNGAALTTSDDTVINAGIGASPAVIDIDGDGDKDLVVGNADGQLLLYVNDATDASAEMKLLAGVEIGDFTGAVMPLAADWNADGKRELLVANDGALSLLGQVDGRYVVVGAIVEAGAGTRFSVADIDGGNGKDIFVGSEDGRVRLYRSAGKDYQDTVTGALIAKLQQLEELGADPAQVVLVTAAIEGGSYNDAIRLTKAIKAEGDLANAVGETLALLGR